MANFIVLKSKNVSTAELKVDLISQIAGISDEVRLRELLELISFQNSTSVYVTDVEEKMAIKEAQMQIAHGQVLSDVAVRKEVNEWLNK